MQALELRLAAWARARWRSAVLVALLAGLSAGLVLALLAGVRRTASAPDRYTASLGGNPELLLMQPFGAPLTERIAAIPGVREARSATFVSAFPVGDAGPVLDPNPYAGDDHLLGGRPVEGRFTDPTAPDEMTLNERAASLLGVHVGDRLDVRSFSQEQVVGNEFQPGGPMTGPSFDVTVVGIIEHPTDIEDRAASIYFSGGVLRAHPDIGTVATSIAVRGQPGTTPASILTAIRSRLPDGFDVVEQESRIVPSATRRAIHLHVVALWVVAGMAALVATLVIVQLATRQVRSTDDDRGPLRAIGYEGRQLVTEAAVKSLIVGAGAAVVAVVVAIALSRVFPIGSLHIVEPDPGMRPDLVVAVVGAAAIAITFVLAGAVTAARASAHRAPRGHVRSGVPDVVASLGAGPSLVNGVRFATTSTGASRSRPYAVALSVIAGVAGVVGAIVVDTSLVRLLDEPPLWGANYDAAFGNPFTPTDRDLVTPAASDPDVSGLTAATWGSLTIDGSDVPVLAFEPIRGGILPVVLAGRAPSAPDEIAIGRVVARHLGRVIGDPVTAVGADGSDHELRVVGYAATPSDGGNGAAMTFDAFRRLVPDATRNMLLVNYRDGAARDEVAARLTAVAYTPPETESLPTSIRAFELVIPAVFALMVVLAAMAIAALGYHLASSVYRRTNDFAILRALGADRRQVRATVHWQACFVAAVGLLVGVPLGIGIGRRVYMSIADSLGVVPAVATPFLLVLGVVAGVLAVANLSAVGPALRATRSRAATALGEGAFRGF